MVDLEMPDERAAPLPEERRPIPIRLDLHRRELAELQKAAEEREAAEQRMFARVAALETTVAGLCAKAAMPLHLPVADFPPSSPATLAAQLEERERIWHESFAELEANLNGTILRLNDTVLRLREEAKVLQAANAALVKDLRAANEAMAMLRREREVDLTLNANVSGEVQASRAEIAQLKARLEDLRSAESSASTQLRAVNAANLDLLRQRDGAQNQVTFLEKEIAQLRQRLDQIRGLA